MSHEPIPTLAPMGIPIERHPFEPFLPDGCRLLMLGSFPPAEKRWTMRFYYPNQQKIGLYDTACAVRRLKNTASDKDLEVVEPTDLKAMVRHLPALSHIVTTGQKATDVLCQCFNITQAPVMGSAVTFLFEGRELHLWRMPSSSRAYPMKVEQKAEYYAPLFAAIFHG